MSTELDDLYQEVILDHGRKPRNFHKLEDANRQAEGLNPLCGDHFKLYVKLDGDRIQDIAFEGSGCAISKASASMMTDAVKGKTEGEAGELFRAFHALVTGENGAGAAPDGDPRLGKLVVFAGVRDYPVRVKCATLAWHTLRVALENRGATASTE
jgi:nitrogen fixation protein NifU and related proteins